MITRLTPERLAEIRAFLKDWIDSPFGSELLAEVVALTAERDTANARIAKAIKHMRDWDFDLVDRDGVLRILERSDG